MNTRKTLYLVDGSAVFYRAYFAFIRNPLINSKGENTSATYGFVNSLLKIIDDERPDYLAIVFDTKEPTFRHKMYTDYKSTRAKMPDDLVTQLPRIRQAVMALNIVSYEMPGFEADDIIGTIATKAGKEGFEVWCVTGDKDYFQLVTDNVRIYNPKPASEKPERMGPLEVENKFGVPPTKVIDKLALMGDSSDNVPGIPGIGPKTADSLLTQFGSLDAILENHEQIKAKGVRSKVAENIELARLSRTLVTIDTDVPVSYDIDDMLRRTADYETCKSLFLELEFSGLFKRLFRDGYGGGEDVVQEEAVSPQASYSVVVSLEHLRTVLKHLAERKEIAVDTETTSVNALKAKLVGVSLCGEAGEAFYVPLAHSADSERNLPFDDAVALLKDLLENPKVQKIGQNIKYDLHVLRRHGINVNPISFDTMLASYVLDPSSRQHSLDLLALKHFDYQMQPITDLIGKGKSQRTFDTVPIDMATPYAAEDADFTYRLRGVLAPQLEEHDLVNLYYNFELPLVEVLAAIEEAGIRVDTSYLESMSKQMDKQLEQLRADIYDMGGGEFNINSTQQLSHILFDKLGLPTKGRTAKKTGYATDVRVLEELSQLHDFPKSILDYRQLTKLKSTYVDAIPKLVDVATSRVHTSFNQTIAATGRLSSTDPNLQNIPIRTEEGRLIRKAFVPRDNDHVLVVADYSQIELRILAHYADDPGLIEAFKKGEDIHMRTAAEVFGADFDKVTPEQRRSAKTANFAVIYGVSAFGLAQQTGMNRSEAQQFIDTYFARYPGIRKYMDETIAFARENGYVTTMFNRRRYLREINDRNHSVRQFAERTAINTPIQGTAADMIKKAMIVIQKKLASFRSRIVLQVHDELVCDVYKPEREEVAKILRDGMEKAVKLKVPVTVDIGVGDNWLDAKG